MNLLADLEDFIHDHRLHGSLTGDATEPTRNGYRLTVACRYGVVFEQRDTLHPSRTIERPAKSLI